jgi:hypothetical protein
MMTTTYHGVEITTYRNTKQAEHDLCMNKLPPGVGDWYWHLGDNLDTGPFRAEKYALNSAKRKIDGFSD